MMVWIVQIGGLGGLLPEISEMGLITKRLGPYLKGPRLK